MFGRRRQLRIAHHDERLRHHQTDAAGGYLARLWNVHAAQRWMIADVVRRVAVRHLPDDVAAIEIEGGDRAVRRLHDRQRSEEHTSELQSHSDLVCRLLLEKKKNDMSPSAEITHAA